MAGVSHPKSLKDFGGDRAKGKAIARTATSGSSQKMLMKNNPKSVHE